MAKKAGLGRGLDALFADAAPILEEIEAPAGSGTVMLNGPAAREGYKGDVLVIITYAEYEEAELKNYKANVVKVDDQNRVK